MYIGILSANGRDLGRLGPDAFHASLSDFQNLLQRNRQIKGLLLDQTAVAGLGNIYVDESLHKLPSAR